MFRVADKRLVAGTRLDNLLIDRRFARVAASATTQITSNTTTPVITLPTGYRNGDILFVWIRGIAAGFSPGAASSRAAPTGWALISDWSSPDASDDFAGLWVRQADGSEGSTVTMAALRSTGMTYVAISVAVRNGSWFGLESTGVAGQGGSGTAADPPSLTPNLGKQKWLWLAFVSYEDNITVSAAPTNYSGLATTNLSGFSSGVNACTVAYAWRQREIATEDPGTFTGAGSNAKMNITVSVLPAWPRWAEMRNLPLE